jgi:hypothetical protein
MGQCRKRWFRDEELMEDISRILNDWEFDAEDICARKIVGQDGREKLQVRVDLGMLQMDLDGRPDGDRPHGKDSLLEFFQEKGERRNTNGKGPFQLTDKDCDRLGQEGLQYYHRYVCLLRLGDYDRVIADTRHNLEIFDLVDRYSENDEQKLSCEQYRPYVTMINTRARGELMLLDDDYDEALKIVEDGIHRIEGMLDAFDEFESSDESEEIFALQTWSDEIRKNRPVSLKQRLAQQLQEAISDERYERAATLRDRLKGLEKKRF